MNLLSLFDRAGKTPVRQPARGERTEAMPTLPAVRQSQAIAVARPAEDLPEAFRTRRDERWQFCRDAVELMRTRDLKQAEAVTILLATCPDKYSHIRPSHHNLRRWLSKLGSYRTREGALEYNFDNLAALADDYAVGAQPKRFDDVAYRVFMAMYLTPRAVPFSVCYRETKALFAREYREVKFPTQSQFRYQLSKEPQNVIDCGRYGIDYVENHSLYMLIRDWSQIRPGQCWFADSRPFDQLIRVPDGKGGWRAERPDVTYIMDAASWYCVGFDVTGEAVNNDMIRNLFARACVEHGRPECFYVDNGSDYNKQGFAQPVTVEGREYSILQSLGVRLTNARPYHGRSKTVERNFRDFSLDFDRRQPSYLGDSPANRPDSAEMYYSPAGVMLLPSLEEFCAQLRAEVARFHDTPRGGRFKGLTPRRIWEGNDRISRAPLSPVELHRALLLPLPAPRLVHRGGCIDVARVRYYAPELEQYTGRKVIVKTSYMEPGRIHAFDLKGAYLGECTAQSATHPLATVWGDETDKAVLEQQLVIQGRQRREVLTRFRDLTAGLGGLSVEEIKALSRSEIESGKARITLASKSKVKAGEHNLKLLTTRAAAAEARQVPASPAAPERRSSNPDRVEFDKEFSAMMAGDEVEKPKQGETNYDDFQL